MKKAAPALLPPASSASLPCMKQEADDGLILRSRTVQARLRTPSGQEVDLPVEIRTSPVTGRTCRIALSRSREREPGTESLPGPPPGAADEATCPFCPPRLEDMTPRLRTDLFDVDRLELGSSTLFPNLYPYGPFSAVSLFDSAHFVEIGTASRDSYAASLKNCIAYLARIKAAQPDVRHMAITQNHLPSAGGSLVHPHLQVNAESIPANHQRTISQRAASFHARTGRLIFSELLDLEKANGSRVIGRTGSWEWLAAFAPEGFFEIWGLLPGQTSLFDPSPEVWGDLAQGILNVQRFYRSLNRNSYNLGLLSFEDRESRLELRAVIMARSNYAPWVRNDHTGFEVMLGDMTTFTAPEDTAARARAFFTP